MTTDAGETVLGPPDSCRLAADERRAVENRTNRIEDALRIFDADHLLISTHPVDRSTWLERRVVERARARFAPPITHVIVDLRAGLAQTPAAQSA